MNKSEGYMTQRWALQQVCAAAPGWRAVFKSADRYWTSPVACWAMALLGIEHWPDKRATDPQRTEMRGIRSVGLVPIGAGLRVAESCNGFCGYCGPDHLLEDWLKERERHGPSSAASGDAAQVSTPI